LELIGSEYLASKDEAFRPASGFKTVSCWSLSFLGLLNLNLECAYL
jgi:hypothetical protein